MHQLNPYKIKPPNFEELAKKYPRTFGVHVKKASGNLFYIDWRNEDAVRSLTETILQEDFHIRVQLPSDYLCPPITNRLNYLCWLEEIRPNFCISTLSAPVYVLDIGTGASCIYPVLGYQFFGWNFTGFDIDAVALSHARATLDENKKLAGHIHLVNNKPSHEIQELLHDSFLQARQRVKPKKMMQSKEVNIGATVQKSSIETSDNIAEEQICSHVKFVDLREFLLSCTATIERRLPREALRGPIRCAFADLDAASLSFLTEAEGKFYSSENTASYIPPQHVLQQPKVEGESSFTFSMCNPPFYDIDEQIFESERTVCTGRPSEMKTPGGEVAFVAAMILDSLVLRDRVRCYTTMVGKKSSVKVLLRLLANEGIRHVRTTRFTQGRTMRWGIAWSFLPCPDGAGVATEHKLFGQKKKLKKRKRGWIGGSEGGKRNRGGENEADEGEEDLISCWSTRISWSQLLSTALPNELATLPRGDADVGAAMGRETAAGSKPLATLVNAALEGGEAVSTSEETATAREIAVGASARYGFYTSDRLLKLAAVRLRMAFEGLATSSAQSAGQSSSTAGSASLSIGSASLSIGSASSSAGSASSNKADGNRGGRVDIANQNEQTIARLDPTKAFTVSGPPSRGQATLRFHLGEFGLPPSPAPISQAQQEAIDIMLQADSDEDSGQDSSEASDQDSDEDSDAEYDESDFRLSVGENVDGCGGERERKVRIEEVEKEDGLGTTESKGQIGTLFHGQAQHDRKKVSYDSEQGTHAMALDGQYEIKAATTCGRRHSNENVLGDGLCRFDKPSVCSIASGIAYYHTLPTSLASSSTAAPALSSSPRSSSSSTAPHVNDDNINDALFRFQVKILIVESPDLTTTTASGQNDDGKAAAHMASELALGERVEVSRERGVVGVVGEGGQEPRRRRRIEIPGSALSIVDPVHYTTANLPLAPAAAASAPVAAIVPTSSSSSSSSAVAATAAAAADARINHTVCSTAVTSDPIVELRVQMMLPNRVAGNLLTGRRLQAEQATPEARAEFAKMTDKLQNDVHRSNRRWRRALLAIQQRQKPQ